VESDDRDDPSGLAARHQLERRLIVANYWRAVRRRASFLVILSVPVLAGLIAASFPLLTRSRITGTSAVITVSVLGGLLGSLLVCVPKLASLAGTSHPSGPQLRKGLLPGTVLWPLLAGASAGLASALMLLAFTRQEAYKPQTLYLVATAAAVALSRLGARTVRTIELGGVDGRAARR
jgi:hypothetical protein